MCQPWQMDSDAQKAAKTSSSKARGCLGEARKEDEPDPQKLFVQVFKKFSFFLT